MKINNCRKVKGVWCGDAVLHGERVELFAPGTIENSIEAKSFMIINEITNKNFLPKDY